MSSKQYADVRQSDMLFDGWRHAEKEVTLDGSAGAGAVGTIDLFSVTGTVKAKIIAVCSTNLVSAGGGTLEVGVTGSTAGLIAQTTGTDIDAGEIWHDATPDSPIESSSISVEKIIANGLDIFATVGTGDITAGAIKFMLLWKPVSQDGDILPA